MISILWTFLIVIGILYSFLTGNINVINESILTNADKALKLILSLFPTIVLWFPSVPKDNPSLGYIASNIAANMLGLGSAATPFGLKAMSELQKINDKKDIASTPMITFLVLNTAGVTIIPTTIIAIRLAYNSLNPTEIIAPALISTSCSCLSAVLIDYFIRRKKR